jgi:hypothetical protein
MTRAILVALCLGLLATTGVAVGYPRTLQEHPAIQEPLRQMPPKYRAGWLRSRGLDDSYYTTYHAYTDSGLRLIGKYGRGPAVEVTGRDSLVFLALGSEVAVVNVADLQHPLVLSEIQVNFCPKQVAVRDSLLFVGGNGVEVWNVAIPNSPQFVSRIPYAADDFCVRDSLLFFVSLDTFMVYSVANPAAPQRLGFYPDSGYATSCAGNTVVLVQDGGVAFANVADPAHPRRAGSFSTKPPISAFARGGLCCVTECDLNDPTWLRLRVLDITNPASVIPLSALDSAGGYDLFITDSLVFASGYYTGAHDFQVISLRDSVHPSRVGGCLTPGDGWAVLVNRTAARAYVADPDCGLAFIDIANMSVPVLDTAILRADMAMDVAVQGNLAFVADYTAGLKVLDLTDPTTPTEIGHVDTATFVTSEAVAGKDSFAFAGWWATPYFRSFDVSDPSHPEPAGSALVQTIPEAMVLRDTIVYLAGRLRFNVVNVARPREPVLVGSCVLTGYSGDLPLVDTTAYLSGPVLSVVNVARADSPRVVSTWSRGVSGLDVADTVLYAVGQNARFWTLGVADPTSPRLLDSITLPSYDGEDVAVVGTKAYVSEVSIRILDVSNPGDLRMIGQASVPQWTPRLVYAAPYLYACCAEGGVCVFEILPTGIDERTGTGQRNGLTILPSVTEGRLVIRGQILRESPMLVVFDVSGKEVMRATMPAQRDGESGRWLVDLSRLSAGVYVLRLRGKGVTEIGKVIITRR